MSLNIILSPMNVAACGDTIAVAADTIQVARLLHGRQLFPLFFCQGNPVATVFSFNWREM